MSKDLKRANQNVTRLQVNADPAVCTGPSTCCTFTSRAVRVDQFTINGDGFIVRILVTEVSRESCCGVIYTRDVEVVETACDLLNKRTTSAVKVAEKQSAAVASLYVYLSIHMNSISEDSYIIELKLFNMQHINR